MESKEVEQSEFVSRLISEVASAQMRIDARNTEKPIYLGNRISLVREALEWK